ncbi:MAG: peroxiredoxin-like family protein [Rhizomicrobium sp.]
MAGKFLAGERIAPHALLTASGQLAALPDATQLVHLQFRRFAGCPVCNLHLRSFARRIGEIEAAGVRELVIFHSTPEEMRKYMSELPFAVVGDPDKRLYREFGVEAAPRALADPRAWPGIARSVGAAAQDLLRGKAAANLAPLGGRLGLPADFLIAPDGRIVACKYGAHADDQWSVDEVLARAARRG